MQIGRILQNSYTGRQVDPSLTKKLQPANANQINPMPSPAEKLENLKNILGEKELYRLGVIECETCANRRYQDGSDDPGVSFKPPGKISPGESASVVMSHEMEHVANEQAKAAREDRQVISQSVQLFTSVCPECGTSYVSGGQTSTTTASRPEKINPAVDEDMLKGLYVDERR